MKDNIKKLVENDLFVFFIIVCILSNTVILALDKHPQSETHESLLNTLNLSFTVIFSLEMLLKIFGLGFADYLKDRFNIFDAILVIISIVDLILQESVNFQGSGLLALLAFRSLRLFRILKLARSWVNLRHLLISLFSTFK